jgi:large subunit ribosomal protein L21
VYAIISDGGFQYRVEEGLTFDVQRKELDGKAESIEFDRVLMVGDLGDGPKVGRPVVEGAKVIASVVNEFKAPKVIIRKFNRRKGYALKKGHRQKLLRVRVDKIVH